MFARTGFRRLWLARTTSQAGDIFAGVALAVLVFDLTGSALGVSAVVLAEIVPVLLFAPLAGTLVDRLPRIAVMVSADLLRASLAIALVFLAGHVVAVYLIAFGLSVGAALFNPAANSVLPALVDDRELIAANSGIWTAAVLSQIALAPIAGITYGTFGASPAFLINAVSFVASAAILSTLRAPAATWYRAGRLVRRRCRGCAAAGPRPCPARARGRAAVGGLVRGGNQCPAGRLGSGTAAAGARRLRPATRRDRRRRRRRPCPADPAGRQPAPSGVRFGPYLLRGVVDLVLAAITALPVALTALTLYGLSTSSGAVTFNSLLQSHTPAPLRGRVFASFDMLWQLGRLLSLFLGAALAAAVGIQAVYLLGGGLLILAAVIGWIGLRHPHKPTQG